MNYVFIVQGEGRGHMTQALALFHLLQKGGHAVTHVIVGKSKRRSLPTFFTAQIRVPITQLESPNFVTDRDNRSVSIWKTLFVNLRKSQTFLRSIAAIDVIVKAEKPDTIINFYDFLGGLFFLLKRPKVKHITLAHQYLLGHASFEFPAGRFYDKASLLLGNMLAGFGAEKKLALSFQPLANEPRKRLYVVPPLLRQQIKQQKPTTESHFLVYMVNHGYAKEVHAFHKQHPDVPIHCFWDKPNEPKELVIDDTLTFHQLDDALFIAYMTTCKGYLTTAGFESVCEAMYLGKPVLMVPVAGHYEQACNALDALKAGAGISSQHFDLEALFTYLPNHASVETQFQAWCDLTEATFLKMLT